MKLGETGDPLYAYSFDVEEGYSTPEWPYDKAVKVLEAIDGRIIDVINFGAREHRTAQFNLNWMTRAAAAALKTFVDANLGNKIRVEIEDAAEHVFGEQYLAGVYYAYLVAATALGETDFSPSRSTFGYSLSLDLAGTTSTAVPNSAGTSQYDFQIKMDCVRVTSGCQVANVAALNAITNKPGGSRGLALDTLKLYIFNPVNSTWEYQYKLPANDPTRGLKNGVFRWSAFSDISNASAGSGGEDWKSGWIVERSIKFPRYSVDARQGPAVEHPEGFSWSSPNAGKLWKYPLDNNLAFYGAECEISVFDRANGISALLRTGYNNQNAFDYSVMDFIVEPLVFFLAKSFPSTVVGPDNYPDADASVRGNVVQATYGRFTLGALQAINFTMNPVKFANGRRYLGFVNYDATTPFVTLDIDASQFSGALAYPYSTYPATTTKFLYVQIIEQDNQPDINKLIRITAIASPAANQVKLTLKDKWALAPNPTAQFQVMLSSVILILDDDPCIGFEAPGYLKDTAEAGQRIPIEIWAKQDSGTELSAIPAGVFKAVGSGENTLTVDTEDLSLDTFGDIVTKTQPHLDLEYPAYVHAYMDQFLTGYSKFNFGFTPKGLDSNTINVAPFDKQDSWQPIILEGSYIGGRHCLAAFSNDRTTVIWRPLQGATGYLISRYLFISDSAPGWNKTNAQKTSLLLDQAFGTAGYVTVSGVQTTVYIDTSIDNTNPNQYEYHIQPVFASGPSPDSIITPRGQNRLVPNGVPGIIALGKDGGITVAWPLVVGQANFTVQVDSGSGFADLSGMPIVSSTQTSYEITGLANNQIYGVKIAVASLSVGVDGDYWYAPTANVADPIHMLKTGSQDPTLPSYDVRLDATRSNMQNPLLFPAKNQGIPVTETRFQLGYIARNFNTPIQAGAGFPTAAVLFSWALQIDHDALGDLSDAKGVSVLTDFVCRSYSGVGLIGAGHTDPENMTIQLRGIRKDKTVAFTIEHASLQGKAPTETGAYGSYLQFLNLPEALSGAVNDVNYKNDVTSSNVNGLYTGAGLWKIPDRLFADGATEWKSIQNLVFTITNSDIITWTRVRPTSGGYSLGIGGPPGQTWNVVKSHKSDFFLEVLREFKGGLTEPEYIRIDGGKKDVDGSITGVVGAPIERIRDIADDICLSMLGSKPTYIGNEMASRRNWVGRLQTKTAMSTQDTLLMLARNMHCFFTLTPDGGLAARSLDIDDPNVPVVFAFTDSNIIVDSLGKPEMRLRSEIFQKFQLQYNIDPTVNGGAPTESMLMGYDTPTGKPIYAGYSRTIEDANGNLLDTDSLDSLPDLCRLSIQLNAAGAGANEFGLDPTDEKIYEMFYRPTTKSATSQLVIEQDLPGLAALWGSNVRSPKVSMQELTKMVVRFFTFDAWYFPLSVSMKNLIYNPAVTGLKDEIGTPDNKLKLGDLVTVTSDFHTNGQAVKCLILDIELAPLYDGYATLHVFAPRPPGQFGVFVDGIWDAGAPGPRNQANYQFKSTLYGLLNENGTFADAGAPGARDTSLMTFPDGTFADPKGSGSGKA